MKGSLSVNLGPDNKVGHSNQLNNHGWHVMGPLRVISLQSYSKGYMVKTGWKDTEVNLLGPT